MKRSRKTDMRTSWRLPLPGRRSPRSPVFAALPDSELAAFNGLGELVSLEGRVEVFRQGEMARHIYRLVQGRIRVFVASVSGGRSVARTLCPGGILGISAGFSRAAYEASAVTSISSIVQKIQIDSFLNFLRANSQATAFVAQVLAQEYLDLLKHAVSSWQSGTREHVL
jgi:CRP-like cAMP-binding protein